ncbi:hypothetical protein [Brevibacillus laterosporus]|uniref:hypothetical protein n=1 Tax=Brevibacillus laterosporus TaxID=1465 RepID=UPI002404B04C|nr:hypothetical protein [Brevibacillus laterosporus]
MQTSVKIHIVGAFPHPQGVDKDHTDYLLKVPLTVEEKILGFSYNKSKKSKARKADALNEGIFV